jgi:hypothetical protein
MWPQFLSSALGAWLMADPTVLGLPNAGLINDRVVGPLVVLIGLTAAHEIMRPWRWLNVLLGLWTLIAPWALGYPWAGILNATAVGVLLIVFGLIRGRIRASYGGGWAALFVKGEP